MENIENTSKNLNETILRYPFNGRSKYLIDKFFIMGFDSKTLYKNLIENNTDEAINKSNSSLNISLEELFSKSEVKKIPQIFHIDDPPTVLNEITSDYKKQIPDKDLIKDMIIPNQLDFFLCEESIKKKSFYSSEINYRQKTILSRIATTNNDYIENKIDYNNDEFNCIFAEDEISKNNSKYIKPYNVIFSYNPQTENNSKKSINGFAHIFYRKYYKNRNLGDRIVSYYVPIIFCIISEFPFYNSFYLLCNQIKNLYKEKNIEVPLEILIYNIINYTVSPINNDIFLFIEPIKFHTKKIELQILKENNKKKVNFHNNFLYNNKDDNQIAEAEIFEEIEEEGKKENNINNNDVKQLKTSKIKTIKNLNKISQPYKKRDRRNIKSDNLLDCKISIDSLLNMNENMFENIYENKEDGPNNKENKLLENSSKDKKNKKNIREKTEKIKEKTKNDNNKIRTYSKMENKNSSEINFNNSSSSYKSIHNMNNKPYENIKFCFLPGYPLIQYNLVKVLLNALSPQDVIIVFIHSFLEKDIVFFSKDIEYLSLSIDAYLNLNFPLNDEKYYFFNACVSYDNYINNNSTFVGSTFTTMIGVNNSYPLEYKNINLAKSKEHLCVDLDNGNLHFMKDNTPNIFSQNGRTNIFDFIKKICRNKDLKEEKENNTILAREIRILYDTLFDYKNKLNNKNNLDFYKNISKCNFIDYNEENNNCNIKNANKEIQEAFYRLVNNLCLYFYQNLSIKDEIIDPKKEAKNKKQITSSIRKSLRTSADIETMSIIFKKDYLIEDENNNIYTKEELAFLEELTDTMKFESFVYGFIQSYNPIDLYKIPLTFTEEFLSILSRKNTNLKNINYNFLSLIDILYERNAKKNLYVDSNPFLSRYYRQYKSYFDREIFDIYNKSANLGINNCTIGINFKNVNDDKIVIENFKYKSYELDKNIILKYKTFINNLNEEEYLDIFYLSKILEKNDIKKILLTDIENQIEKFAIEIGILSKRDICCSNIMLLFIISIKNMIYYENLDCPAFLFSLFSNFIVFRKYYTMIMNILYQLLKSSLNEANYSKAKKYLLCYYPCLNSLRNLKLIPNESLMNIIKKFNLIKVDALLEKVDNKEEKEKENNNKNRDKKIDLSLKYDSKYIHLSHNFDKNKFYKENEIIEKINSKKENDFKIDFNEKIRKNFEPKINYYDGKFKYKCKFISQAEILEGLTHQYNIFYNNNFDENKVNIQEIFNACLNIDIFIRNSVNFKDKEYIIDSLHSLFSLYLNKLLLKQNAGIKK